MFIHSGYLTEVSDYEKRAARALTQFVPERDNTALSAVSSLLNMTFARKSLGLRLKGFASHSLCPR